MQERGLVGLEARTADGDEVGRIAEVITDEQSGEVTHVLVEQEDGEAVQIPISQLVLDPEADFAAFHADPSDDRPGDHVEDEVELRGYAPAETDGPEDYEHDNQLVTEPPDPAEAKPPEDIVKESGEAGGWQDEAFISDSGYPRNDVYIDPDTGEEQIDPALQDNETLSDDVADLLNGTNLRVSSEKDGVVELTGSVSGREALEGAVKEIMGLDGVLDVDTTDVDVG